MDEFLTNLNVTGIKPTCEPVGAQVTGNDCTHCFCNQCGDCSDCNCQGDGFCQSGEE